MNKETKSKIEALVVNTVLNSFQFINNGEDYNYWEEALEWAKNYFPEMNNEEFLSVARKYDVWNEFEKTCKETI